jgi:hypothetical protein
MKRKLAYFILCCKEFLSSLSFPQGSHPRRYTEAKTLASCNMSEMRQNSLGWWAVSAEVDHTAAGKPYFLKKAATVPPPIPMGLASRPLTSLMALARALTTGESEGVGSGASCLCMVSQSILRPRSFRLFFHARRFHRCSGTGPLWRSIRSEY